MTTMMVILRILMLLTLTMIMIIVDYAIINKVWDTPSVLRYVAMTTLWVELNFSCLLLMGNMIRMFILTRNY